MVFHKLILISGLSLKKRIKRPDNSEPEFQNGNSGPKLSQNRPFRGKEMGKEGRVPLRVEGSGRQVGSVTHSRQREYFVYSPYLTKQPTTSKPMQTSTIPSLLSLWQCSEMSVKRTRTRSKNFTSGGDYFIGHFPNEDVAI